MTIPQIKKWLRKAVLIVTAAALLWMQAPVYAISEERNVLFISSYSLSSPSVRKQIDGIKAGLSNDVYLYYEFMDSRTISSDQYVEHFYQYLVDKYSDMNDIDAVIVGDDDALQMVLSYRSGIFKDLPVIYESVDSSTRAELAHSLGMTGLSENITIMDNLDLAVHMFPHANQILAVTDESKSGEALSANLKGIQKKYRSLSINILDTTMHTQDEITETIQQAGNSAIILYMSFNNDSSGKSYTSEESLQLVIDNASSPVFTLSWMEQGSIGSIETDSEKAGRAAGEMVMECLNGTSISQLQASKETSTIATFDVEVMNKYGVNKSNLPKDTVYVNDHSNILRMIFLLCGIGAALFILLLLLRRSRKENKSHEEKEQQLEKTSEMLKAEAEIDELTQLGNRRTLDRELSRTSEAGRKFVLYLIDVDEFKHVNDNYGHLDGDEVLHEIGRRLSTLKSRTFMPYRYGGDEFAVMYFDSEQQETMGSTILHLFDAPVHREKYDIPISVSIGSSIFTIDADNRADLIAKADEALYEVKENGRKNYRSYQSLAK